VLRTRKSLQDIIELASNIYKQLNRQAAGRMQTYVACCHALLPLQACPDKGGELQEGKAAIAFIATRGIQYVN
jgi:hypothetical protein